MEELQILELEYICLHTPTFQIFGSLRDVGKSNNVTTSSPIEGS